MNNPQTTTDAVIINRGRGPEIAGTRITVYDILDYTTNGWEHAAIAKLLRLSLEQVAAAVEYIDEHQDDVMPQYERILERDRRGNPPEIQARLDRIHVECQAEWAERRRQTQENNGARDSG